MPCSCLTFVHSYVKSPSKFLGLLLLACIVSPVASQGGEKVQSRPSGAEGRDQKKGLNAALKHANENSVVPPGLEASLPRFPALKRWAKLERPYGAALSRAALHDAGSGAAQGSVAGPAQSNVAGPSVNQGGIADPSLGPKVEALLRKMTLDEKVGQLVQYSAGQPTGPGTGRTDYNDMIRKGEVGALFNITTAHDINAYQRIAVEQSRLHIPLLFGLDVIHGFRTEFPIPLGMASSWDPNLIEQTARVAARETSASGIRWTFSPMVDIARDARWGRMTEGSGEDPFLGAALARAYVRGYQGARLDAPDSIAACPKHFVGYAAAEGGRDYNSVEISEHTLRQFYLPPFHAAIDAGAAT